MNKDPLREAGGYNLYAYANNNPINFIDAEGKAPKGIWGTPLSTDDNCELVGGIIGATAAFASAGPVGVANGFVIATLGGQVGQRIGKGISSMIRGGCGGAGIIGPEWKTGKPTSPTDRCNIIPSRSINGASIPMSTAASIRPGW